MIHCFLGMFKIAFIVDMRLAKLSSQITLAKLAKENASQNTDVLFLSISCSGRKSQGRKLFHSCSLNGI